jgi:uncharacterized protein (TIGR00369 family)
MCSGWILLHPVRWVMGSAAALILLGFSFALNPVIVTAAGGAIAMLNILHARKRGYCPTPTRRGHHARSIRPSEESRLPAPRERATPDTMDNVNEPNPLHAAMPFTALLDLRPIRQDHNQCVIEMDWHERVCTASGIVHGGALMSLADTAGAVLAFANLPSGALATTTIESKTNLFAAARAGSTLTATAVVLHAGRTTMVVETEVRDQTGRLVAKTTQTQAILTAH